VTSVIKRQYKYDLAMKWKKGWSSDKQGHRVPLVSSVLHIVYETVCPLVSSASTGQVWRLRVILQALGVRKVLIILFQNSQILLSRTETVYTYLILRCTCMNLSSFSLILAVVTWLSTHSANKIIWKDVIYDRYSVKSVLLYFWSFFFFSPSYLILILKYDQSILK
jgi:hypothetical protein